MNQPTSLLELLCRTQQYCVIEQQLQTNGQTQMQHTVITQFDSLEEQRRHLKQMLLNADKNNAKNESGMWVQLSLPENNPRLSVLLFRKQVLPYSHSTNVTDTNTAAVEYTKQVSYISKTADDTWQLELLQLQLGVRNVGNDEPERSEFHLQFPQCVPNDEQFLAASSGGQEVLALKQQQQQVKN
jgi:hypothetical protein